MKDESAPQIEIYIKDKLFDPSRQIKVYDETINIEGFQVTQSSFEEVKAVLSDHERLAKHTGLIKLVEESASLHNAPIVHIDDINYTIKGSKSSEYVIKGPLSTIRGRSTFCSNIIDLVAKVSYYKD